MSFSCVRRPSPSASLEPRLALSVHALTHCPPSLRAPLAPTELPSTRRSPSLACPCSPIDSPSQTWPMHPQPSHAVLCPPCLCLEFPNPDMMLTGRPNSRSTLDARRPRSRRNPCGTRSRQCPCRRHAIMTYPFRPGSEGYKRTHLDGFPPGFFLSTFN
jgi:hypothetical protein